MRSQTEGIYRDMKTNTDAADMHSKGFQSLEAETDKPRVFLLLKHSR